MKICLSLVAVLLVSCVGFGQDVEKIDIQPKEAPRPEPKDAPKVEASKQSSPTTVAIVETADSYRVYDPTTNGTFIVSKSWDKKWLDAVVNLIESRVSGKVAVPQSPTVNFKTGLNSQPIFLSPSCPNGRCPNR